MHLLLERYGYLDTCTLGRMIVGGARIFTLERPWITNPGGPGGLPERSCIPDGTYDVMPHDSANHPETYALQNTALGVYYASIPAGQTSGRTACLIHPANRVAELLGCIAPGMQAVILAGEHQVSSSRVAMVELLAALGRRERHQLTIVPTKGTV